MSPLDAFLRIGEPLTVGSHTFTADEIKAFAANFDPQPFHLDEEAAKKSVLGGLCASGWHTTAIWMRLNILYRDVDDAHPWTGDGPRPEFGPSPGFENMRWLRPVLAGATITYQRTALRHRPMASRPGWNILTVLVEAFGQDGAKVMSFESAVLFRTA